MRDHLLTLSTINPFTLLSMFNVSPSPLALVGSKPCILPRPLPVNIQADRENPRCIYTVSILSLKYQGISKAFQGVYRVCSRCVCAPSMPCAAIPKDGFDDAAYAIIPARFPCGEYPLTKPYPGKYLIGLTGNIAVGKSLVRAMLAQLGAAAIDADQIAHQVIRNGSAAYDDIIAAFGNGILADDGEISRAALGEIVFADRARLKQLEGITHPAIRRRIDQLVRATDERLVAIEAIKLLEGELKNAVDAVWVVDASPKTQLSRLISQRGMTESEARRRIALQNSQADKLRQADVIIRNDGHLADTRAQVERAWRAIPNCRGYPLGRPPANPIP